MDRATKRVLAKGRRDQGLYILSHDPQAFAATTCSKIKASYELWHSRLGHVSFDIISLLNKLGYVSVTSLLPSPVICSPCQLAKAHRLPFELNDKRASHVLDLIHCDLWGPSPVTSVDGYRYYAIFVDDHSRHATFDELSFPFKGSSSTASLNDLPLITFQDDLLSSPPLPDTPQPAAPISSTSHTTKPDRCGLCDTTPSPSIDAATVPVTQQPPEVQSPASPSVHFSTPPSAPLPTSAHPISSPIPSDTSDLPHTDPFTSSSLPSTSTPIPPDPHIPPVAPSHPMLTRAKAGIFKPKHRADISCTGLHSALFAHRDPTTYKSAALDSHWLDAMNVEMTALRLVLITPGPWFLDLLIEMWLAVNGCIALSIMPMAPLIDIKLVLLRKGLVRFQALTILILLVQW